MKKLFLGMFFWASMAHANPYETIKLQGSHFDLAEGQTHTLSLGSWRYVQKVYVQAYGVGQNAQFEVVANGDIKGTIFVPGRDPSYVVTIGESVNSLQFRHNNGGTARILDVKAVVSIGDRSPDYRDERLNWKCFDRASVGCNIVGLPANNEAAELARRAIYLTEQLERYASYREYGEYLLPIKKVGARAYSIAVSRGSLSINTYNILVVLRRQIEYSYEYLNVTFERDAAFELAVELMSLGRRIEDLLD